MPHWLFPSMYPTWQRDQDGNILLLKIPKDLDLDPPNPQYSPNTKVATQAIQLQRLSTLNPSCCTTGERNSQHHRCQPTPLLPSLPTEIFYLILDHLPPVDRVCLALTCKALCSAIVSAPRLNPTTWSKFLPRPTGSCVNDPHDLYLYYSPYSYYGGQMPESYTLLQRLAHGWIPKEKLRYCWKCHRILSRDPDFWTRRIKACKKPKWDIRTSCEEDQWSKMDTKKRYQYLIHIWCKASFEDSSILSCDGCREELYAEDNATTPRKSSTRIKQHPVQGCMTDVQSGYVELVDNSMPRPEPTYSPHTGPNQHRGSLIGNKHQTSQTKPKVIVKTKPAQPRYTVECPACLERQLTFTFRLPRRSVVRTFLRDCWLNWGKYLWKAVWLVGTIIVAILSIIYALLSLLFQILGAGVTRTWNTISNVLGGRWNWRFSGH